MVIVQQTPDGDWKIECDYSMPESIVIEDGEIRELTRVLVRIFGVPEADINADVPPNR